MGTWNKIESGLAPTDNKIEFDTESLGKFALKVSEGRLPSEYQEVEYIQSSGTQYIDTAVTITSTLAFKLIAQVITTTNDKWLMGAGHAGSVNASYGLLMDGGNFWYEKGPNSQRIAPSVYDTNKHTFIFDSPAYLDDTNIGTKLSGTYGFNCNLSIFVPTDTSGGYRTGCCSSMKFYSATIYNGSTIHRNFVPCYCTESVIAYKGSTQTTAASGTAGLYDLTENKFYINSGTGVFTTGPDVN